MSELTRLKLPSLVPFPVTVTAIHSPEGSCIDRHQRLLSYRFYDLIPDSTDPDKPHVQVERAGLFESPVTGTLLSVAVKVGDSIPSSTFVVAAITEPCAHTVQYGGLCALCGNNVGDDRDYSGYNYNDRASIPLTHDNTGLKVLLSEARRLEMRGVDRLTESRKLILVVDLDQTVIHATVDPTVGEWQRDPANPNYLAVRDVRTFVLEEDPIVPMGWLGPKPPPLRCTYYVKLRPRLAEFLHEALQKYEMHIYTMATRNYALAIANIIDPKGIYFGDRILSRDESGSLTHKNLKRLFPVDQSMVAIIDDRGDVWLWESNLIKVVPYDFFVGIGDINSSFLPKKNGQLTGPSNKRRDVARAVEIMESASPEESGAVPPLKSLDSGSVDDLDRAKTESSANGAEAHDDPTNDVDLDHPPSDAPSRMPSPSPVDRLLELGGGEDNQRLLVEQSRNRSHDLEQQQLDRPLAKLQSDLHKLHGDADSASASAHVDSDDLEPESGDENLLSDDDQELDLLNAALAKIHHEYYTKWDARQGNAKPDLCTIIPELKALCLTGIVLLFSGILPLGLSLDNADIVIWCRQFGVHVVSELYPNVTHVVCREPAVVSPGGASGGLTFKARLARRILPLCKIVNPDWLFACLLRWARVPEDEFLIEAEPADWRVNERDVARYEAELKQQLTGQEVDLAQYDLEGANEEVDDFLADTDDSMDDNDSDDSDANDGARDPSENSDSFIRDMYKKRKRSQLEDDSDADASDTNMAKDPLHDVDESQHKRRRHLNDGLAEPLEAQENMDELEQELLDGFDDLED